MGNDNYCKVNIQQTVKEKNIKKKEQYRTKQVFHPLIMSKQKKIYSKEKTA